MVRAVVSGTALMQKKAFPDTLPPAAWLCSRETRWFCLLLNQRWSWQMQEQISLTEALRPKARVCAVLVEENPGWEIIVFFRGAISRSGR